MYFIVMSMSPTEDPPMSAPVLQWSRVAAHLRLKCRSTRYSAHGVFPHK